MTKNSKIKKVCGFILTSISYLVRGQLSVENIEDEYASDFMSTDDEGSEKGDQAPGERQIQEEVREARKVRCRPIYRISN